MVTGNAHNSGVTLARSLSLLCVLALRRQLLPLLPWLRLRLAFLTATEVGGDPLPAVTRATAWAQPPPPWRILTSGGRSGSSSRGVRAALLLRSRAAAWPLCALRLRSCRTRTKRLCALQQRRGCRPSSSSIRVGGRRGCWQGIAGVRGASSPCGCWQRYLRSPIRSLVLPGTGVRPRSSASAAAAPAPPIFAPQLR